MVGPAAGAAACYHHQGAWLLGVGCAQGLQEASVLVQRLAAAAPRLARTDEEHWQNRLLSGKTTAR